MIEAKYQVINSTYGNRVIGYEAVIEGVWKFSSDCIEWEWGTFVSSDPEQLKRRAYTGLKDKNGVEIYEGDIVKTDLGLPGIFPDRSHYMNAKVVFDNGGFIFESPVTSERPYIAVIVDLAPIEVIGNIHSNPELLK